MMREEKRRPGGWDRINIPNAITCFRLLLFPLVWFCALKGDKSAVGTLIAVCLATDFLDGFLARMLNRTTSFGAKLDSFADNLMLLSVVFWIWLTLPEVWLNHATILVVFFALVVSVFVIMAIKFGRNVEIHTYLSKFGVAVMWSYIICALLLSTNELFFYLFIASSIAYLLEDIYLLLTRNDLDENEKGVLFQRVGSTSWPRE